MYVCVKQTLPCCTSAPLLFFFSPRSPARRAAALLLLTSLAGTPLSVLSCIDCGQVFGKQDVEGHTQCITEAQSKKISSSGDNANKKILTKNSGEPPQIVKKTKSVVRDSGAMEQARPVEFRKLGSRKELKRKKDSSTTPKSNFFELLEMDMKGRGAVSEDEDLRLERKLAKKLKVKHGRLNAGNDDLDMLLDGIPSALYDIGPTKGHDHAISLKREIKDFADEDLKDDDEINNSEDDDEINDSEEDDDEINDSADEDLEDDDEISSNDGDEESETSSDDEDETENHGDRDLTEGDLALERKLTKKEKKSLDNSTLAEQEKRAQSRITSNIEASGPSGKYVAPHLRSHGGNESAEHAQVRKRVRGLLNRLSETNVESISGEISALYHSVGRSVGSQIITEEVVASCSGGPRGNEQYAAVFAAFVAGMACLVGIDFGGKLLACVAKCFEEEYLKEDNLSLRNLTLLLSYLYFFGVCSSELIYDFLIMLGKRLTEVDVSTVLTVLQCCGMKLRGDDPVGMKNFILSVQSRVNELKASSENAESNINSKRMEFMLETICDIKNNKKRSKEDTVQHTQIKKWLQKLRVDDILIRGLKWGKLLDPNKKGQWWLTGDIASTTENVEEVAGTIDKEIPETKKMLQLAASQRMNTDARRAIFCVIMSGDDYIDAFVKLLRLDLPGKQDREIMRVLVDCCLQEKVFNKYYCVLASKLCKHDKNHKFTLQYCLWDHFKELESMPLIRSMHLAKFVAEMVKSFTLSLAVLKAVELGDLIQLTAKRIMHFRMLFETILESSDKRVWKIFTRIAVMPEHESLRSGVEFFIRKYVVSGDKSLASKFKIAKKALSNVEGVLM